MIFVPVTDHHAIISLSPCHLLAELPAEFLASIVSFPFPDPLLICKCEVMLSCLKMSAQSHRVSLYRGRLLRQRMSLILQVCKQKLVFVASLACTKTAFHSSFPTLNLLRSIIHFKKPIILMWNLECSFRTIFFQLKMKNLG